MPSFVYLTEKRNFLISYSPKDFMEFTISIPNSKLQEVVNQLPSIKGFRPGKDINIRLHTFFNKINRWTDDDWDLMRKIWILWTEAHQVDQNILELNSHSEYIDLVQKMINDDKFRRSIIRKMIKMSYRGSVTNQIIHDWYLFGPFPLDANLDYFFEMAPMQELGILFKQMRTMEEQLTPFDSVLLKDIHNNMSMTQTNDSQLVNLSSEIEKIQPKLKFLQEQESKHAILWGVLENSVGSIANKSETNSKELDVLRRDLFQLGNKVAEAELDLKESLEHISVWNEACKRLPDMQAELMELKQTVVTIRIELDSYINRHSLQATLIDKQQQVLLENDRILNTQIIVFCEDVNPVQLNNSIEAITHVAKNLNLLGIKLSNARRLACEVFAALAAGQVVTFEGTLNRLVAERCALSLASEVHLIKIPVGELDGDLFDKQLEAIASVVLESDFTISVILEGINRSALEVYGARLRQLVVERLFGLAHTRLNLLLFATLVEGPSTIRLGKQILELGPVFSTDALGWMDTKASKGLSGVIPSVTWLEMINLPPIKYEWEESVIPEWLLVEGGALWRRVLLTANLFLENISSSVSLWNTLDPTTNLFFGWVVPMAIETYPDQVQNIVKDIECEDRVKNLIIRMIPEVFQNE